MDILSTFDCTGDVTQLLSVKVTSTAKQYGELVLSQAGNFSIVHSND